MEYLVSGLPPSTCDWKISVALSGFTSTYFMAAAPFMRTVTTGSMSQRPVQPTWLSTTSLVPCWSMSARRRS